MSNQQRPQDRAYLERIQADFAGAMVERQARSFDEVRKQAKSFTGKELVNFHGGMTAIISRNSIDKMLSGKAKNKSSNLHLHLLAVANADSIFRNSIIAWKHNDKKESTDVLNIHRAIAPLKVENDVYLVKLTLKEFARDGNRVYSIEAIDIDNKKSPVPEMVAADSKHGLTSNRHNRALIDIIVQNAQEYNKNQEKSLESMNTLQTEKIREIQHTLEKEFGEETINKLLADGKLHITTLEMARRDSNIDIPEHADGYYLNQQAVLIADNLTAQSASATFLHELGGHGGIQTLLSKHDYEQHLQTFHRLVAEKDPLALEAHALAQKNSPTHAEDEYIPYLLTLANDQRKQTPKIRQFIADIISSSKLFLREKFGINITLKPNDFVVLARKQIQQIAFEKDINAKQDLEAKFSQQTPKNELEEVRQQYQDTEHWLKAPNGNPTNLTETQWLQVRTDSFKAWFGDWEHDADNASKVIDENGEPRVVYHNTEATFTVFDESKARQNMDIPALFFSANPENSLDYGNTRIEAFLNIRNITEKPYVGSRLGSEVKQELISQGFDGTIVDDSYEDYIDIEYAAFSPNQIKSATDNVGTFNKDNADIRYSIRNPHNTPTIDQSRHYLYIPYEDKDKDQAKALGAKWDNDVKSWYVPEGINKDKFSAWTKPPISHHHDPETEFRVFLESFGATVRNLQMDGSWHRLHMTGDKASKMNGSYVGWLDNGKPRGYFKNFKTGEEGRWVSAHKSIMTRTPAEIEHARQQAEQKRQVTYNKVATSAKQIFDVAPIATTHPYLTKKGVQAHGLRLVPDPSLVSNDNPIKIASNWRDAKAMRDQFKQAGQQVTVLTKGDLIIPAYNQDGQLTTLQTISANGFKSYLKDGQKSGSYLVLGEPKDHDPILIAEGYATAATLHEQLNKPVAVAFDSGNLTHTALAIRANYPNSSLYVMADNDHITETKRREQGHTSNLNAGVEKATQAAQAVGGYVILPKFAEQDTGSDWNDLYHSQGSTELKDQIRSQLVDIQAQKNKDLTIHKVAFADKEMARVQDIVMGRAFKNSAILLKRYELDPRTFQGRYIASDMMKEVFPEYNQSPQTRNRFNNAVHNTAAALAAKHFSDELKKPIEAGRDTVVLLTGSPGAGKTSSILNNGNFPDNAKLVFEGQLANVQQNPATLDKIQQALDNGHKVEIRVAHPLPEQALENTFKRFYDPADGRGAPISTMARIQGNTHAALSFIYDKFGDKVSLTINDTTQGYNNIQQLEGWQHLDVLKSQGTEADIKQRLENHLIHCYRQGKIGYDCFRQAAGSDQRARELEQELSHRGRVVQSIHEKSNTHEPRRSLPSGSRQPSNQLGERDTTRNSSGTRSIGSSKSQLSTSKSGIHRQSFINHIDNHPELTDSDKTIIKQWVVELHHRYPDHPDFVAKKLDDLNSKIPDIVSGKLVLPSPNQYKQQHQRQPPDKER